MLAWQFSAYVSYQFEAGSVVVAPYGGIRLSGVDVDVDGHQDIFDPAFDERQTIDYSADQEIPFGVFLGAEAAFTDNFNAYLEFRLIDEYAVGFGGSLRF